MRKLNVLMMASSLGVGVMHNLILLSVSLKKKGHNVIVLYESRGGDVKLANQLSGHGIRHYSCNHLDGRRPRDLILGAKEIREVIHKESVDVIHSNGCLQLFKACLASRLLKSEEKVSLMTSIHTLQQNRSFPDLRRLAMKIVLGSLSNYVLPVSNSTREELVGRFLGPEKTITVYNGIDIEALEREHGKKDYVTILGKDLGRSEGPCIGCFSSFHPWKGQKYLIHAARDVIREFPQSTFVLAGEGPLRCNLRTLSRKMGISDNLLFPGQVRHNHVYQIGSELDIYVSPSTVELLPFSILESMAARKPVVATRVGGVPEMVIDGKTGILVEPGDSDELSEAVLSLARNRELARQMGEEGRRFLEKRFMLDNSATRLSSVYEMAVQLST